MMNDCCKDCAFWLDRPMNPICRRFPKYEIHGAGDWCGEFWSKNPEYQKIIPETFQEGPSDFLSRVEIESVTSPIESGDADPKSAGSPRSDRRSTSPRKQKRRMRDERSTG